MRHKFYINLIASLCVGIHTCCLQHFAPLTLTLSLALGGNLRMLNVISADKEEEKCRTEKPAEIELLMSFSPKERERDE
jgi:hypothetical protein